MQLCRYQMAAGGSNYCQLHTSRFVDDEVQSYLFQGREEFIPIVCSTDIFRACPFKLSMKGNELTRRGTESCAHCGKRHVPGSLSSKLCREWNGFKRTYKEMNAMLPGPRRYFLGGTSSPVFSEECDETMRRQLWPRIQITILRRDKFTCQDCGRDHREVGRKRNGKGMIEVHHIVPRSIGGTDHPGNLKTLCRQCHRRYTNDTMVDVRKANKVEAELRGICLEEHVLHIIEEDASDDLVHLESDQ